MITQQPEQPDIPPTFHVEKRTRKEGGRGDIQERGMEFSPVAPAEHRRIPGRRCSVKQAGFIERLATDCVLDVRDLLARRGVTCAAELSQGEAREIIDWCMETDRHAAEYPDEFGRGN